MLFTRGAVDRNPAGRHHGPRRGSIIPPGYGGRDGKNNVVHRRHSHMPTGPGPLHQQKRKSEPAFGEKINKKTPTMEANPLVQQYKTNKFNQSLSEHSMSPHTNSPTTPGPAGAAKSSRSSVTSLDLNAPNQSVSMYNKSNSSSQAGESSAGFSLLRGSNPDCGRSLSTISLSGMPLSPETPGSGGVDRSIIDDRQSLTGRMPQRQVMSDYTLSDGQQQQKRKEKQRNRHWWMRAWRTLWNKK